MFEDVIYDDETVGVAEDVYRTRYLKILKILTRFKERCYCAGCKEPATAYSQLLDRRTRQWYTSPQLASMSATEVSAIVPHVNVVCRECKHVNQTSV